MPAATLDSFTTALCLGKPLKLAESRVVVPHALARSAVFSSMPGHLARTVYTKPTPLAAWGDVKISQVGGSHLTQSEETIWLMLVRRAMRLGDGAPPHGGNKVKIEFQTADFLRELGQANDSQHRNALRTSIEYLGRARFILDLPTMRYEGNMLDVASGGAKGDSKFCVWLDIAISGVFAAGWSYLNLDHRQALSQNPLSQWLLSHYSTHASPFPIGHEKLKLLANRSAMREDKWLVVLRSALAELQVVTKWQCTLDANLNVLVRKSRSVTSPAAKPVATLMTMSGGACATDEQLLEAWLHSMPASKLMAELRRLESVPPNEGRLMQAPDLRSYLKAVVTGRPGVLDARIAKQRAKEFA